MAPARHSSPPPKLEFLFPAGASIGSTRTIVANGTFSDWPPQVWIDREGVQIVPNKEKGKLDVTISPDAGASISFASLMTKVLRKSDPFSLTSFQRSMKRSRTMP
ncbi:MAG: hypothetical protein R3C05_12920 [Pirellulaceae bacterium]